MMEKLIKSSVCLFLFIAFSNTNVFAKSSIENFPSETIVTAPPIVTTPIYLCQNSIAVPLTATPSVVGATIKWYTALTGGVGSLIAPTPSTAAVGSITYYVTETIAGIESTPRTPIVVNVVADNGTVNKPLVCDPSQILAADKNSSVFFDWGNVLGNPNAYNVSYSIQGGPVLTGSTGNSHWQVFGMLPGQSATLTLTHATLPCIPPQTITCTVPCVTTTTPNFAPITPFCTGTVAPILGATSPNGITGTWSPAIINNTTSGSYIFTPDPILFPCALTQTLPVTVTPLVTPTFSSIPAIVCQGAPAPILPLNSSNATPITGTWSPFPVDTSTLGTFIYTFTPTPGQQCVSATLTKVTIQIVPVVAPNFALIPALCSGSTAPILVTTSPNGITGTWLPSIISNTIGGNYVFTPTAGQCATKQTLTVVITPKVIPDFSAIPAFCSGTTAPILALTSPNGVSGTWTPTTINNTISGNYLFTPNPSECANTQTLSVVVNPLVQPNFVDFPICFGTVAPILATTSPNGITGTWSPSTINNTTSGAYVFTPNAPQCATAKTINVTVNPSNTLIKVDYTVTDAFTKNQMVTITATAAGNYLYQMDSGPFQTSPVFENVASGIHSITVIDANGCSTPITDNNVLVIGYPKYFTPNGDTYNDYWNIYGLKDQPDTRIYIFDRYGKLLKDITPLGLGWDGIYIGQPMPADDYWFTVEYIEQGIAKKFKSHFSLKR